MNYLFTLGITIIGCIYWLISFIRISFHCIVVILVFNGVGSDALHLLREFEQIFNYSTEIGVIVLSILWAILVWKNMRDKKVSLVQQQSRSLVKDFLRRIFQNDNKNNKCSNA